ncbi:Cytosolic seryl-tRNA synthetase, partial [Tulasnella sp. 408]
MTIDVLDLIAEKGGNPEAARESQRKRGESVELVDEVIEMYNSWRSRVYSVEYEQNQLNKQLNALQKDIGAKKKVGALASLYSLRIQQADGEAATQAKEDASELLTQKGALDAQIASQKKAVVEAEAAMRAKCLTIGNIVGSKVPVSQTEDDNAVIRTWHPDGPNGQVEQKKDILPHHEVMLRLDMIDMDR